ncbi:hypothetical protein AZE99_14650 [Sphingorhabdus sp. M41]|nr:hypothetical protein AZE99_14650 [Sphingorhabdus sp. M41]
MIFRTGARCPRICNFDQATGCYMPTASRSFFARTASAEIYPNRYIMLYMALIAYVRPAVRRSGWNLQYSGR